MDIVVTGGSGFVGRVLIPKLLTNFKNSKIINLDKNPYKLPNKNFSTIQINITNLNDISKITLSFSMILGRLEIYTLLVLLTPFFWKS